MPNRYSNSRLTSRTIRFYDQASSKLNTINIEESMTAEQKLYLGLNKAYSSNNKTVVVDEVAKTVLWQDLTFATPPAGFPALTKTDFTLFINGVIVETDAIDSIVQSGSDVLVSFNVGLNYIIEQTDEYMITGKLA
jgi:hypothetical protein